MHYIKNDDIGKINITGYIQYRSLKIMAKFILEKVKLKQDADQLYSLLSHNKLLY